MDIRKIVEAYVAKAIDGSENYSGDDKEANKQIWIQLVTDRIIGAFMGILPEPVDIQSKYELDPVQGLLIRVDPENENITDAQLAQLARYASDQGYNNYRYEVEQIVMKPYNLQKQRQSATLSKGDTNGTKETSKF